MVDAHGSAFLERQGREVENESPRVWCEALEKRFQ
jgi:hypothetical protein